MAKVLDFPMKKLPEHVEEYLYDSASEYVKRMNTALSLMNVDINHPDYAEVMELVITTFINGIIKVTNDQEES